MTNQPEPAELRLATRQASEEDEQKAAHLLVTVLAPRIDQLCSGWDDPDRSLDEGSRLAADNNYTEPYQLSHAVALAISHATDDLAVLRDFTVRSDGDDQFSVQTRPFAAYPLLRAAMENACTAIWLMEPDSRPERLRRRFRLLITDGLHQDEVSGLMGHQNASAKSKRRAAVKPLAVAQGISMGSLDKRVQYSEVVRSAGSIVGQPEATIEIFWRTLSGLTHGDLWASMVMTDREQVAVSDGGVVTFSTTSSLTNIASLTSMTSNLAVAAVRLYDQHRQHAA